MAARGPKAVTVSTTPSEEQQLRRLAEGGEGPAVALRAAIVLACANGSPNAAVAERLSVSVPTVRKWRGRFAASGVPGLRDRDRPRPAGEAAARPAPSASAGGASPHLWEAVAQALRGAILGGELAPGERLGEVEIAARFETSRGPVREAIRELAREGLVVENARRTAIVSTPTERDLVEVYGVRRALEMLAAENLIERLQPGAIATLEGHLDELEGCWRRGVPYFVAARHDLAFHRDLLALAGNRRAIEVNEQMLAQTELLLRTAAQGRPRLRGGMSHHIHRDIVGALRDGDRGALRRAIDNHHRHALERLLGWGEQ